MKNQRAKTQKLICQIFHIKEQQFQELLGDKNPTDELLFGCKTNFYGRIELALHFTKKRMMTVIRDSQDLIDSSLLALLKEKVGNISKGMDYLLKEGILTIYLDMFEQSTKLTMNAQHESAQLFNMLIQPVKILLRYYFIHKEYLKIKDGEADKTNQKNDRIFSEKAIKEDKNKTNGETQEAYEAKAEAKLKEIDHQFQAFDIKELLDMHLKEEEKDMHETLETCRICSTKIKLQNLRIHVNYCQKKCTLKQKLSEANVLVQEVAKKLKTAELQIEKKGKQATMVDKIKLKILKKLKICAARDRKYKRGFSNVGMKNQSIVNSEVEEWLAQLEDLQEGVTDETTDFINKFIGVERQKHIIKTKQYALEMNYLVHSNNNASSSIYSFQSDYKTPKANKGKKSNFAKRNQNNTGSSRSMMPSSSSISNSNSEKSEKKKQLIIKKSKTKPNLKTFEKMEEDFSQAQKRQNSFNLNRKEIHRCCKSMESINNSSVDSDKKEISLNQFDILRFIAKGAFGRVYLARRIETRDFYALKVIQLSNIGAEKELELLRNEHQIFKKIAGEHLVKAPFSFTQNAAHFFVLEYMPGGDLGNVLEEEVYLDQEIAKFYLAEIVLAIEHLHSYQIIHRDLKPENLVIDSSGHLKLTDFGLSEIQLKNKLQMAREGISGTRGESGKRRLRKRRTALLQRKQSQNVRLIGTPDYIAPEIINRVSTSNKSIDWWSFGVMTYEILVGVRPFCGETIEDVVQNIQEFKIEWPEIGKGEGMISEEAYNFINKLLNKDFSERLGAKGTESIKNHPFFQGIDWAEIKKQKPPLIPNKLKNKVAFVDEGSPELLEQVKNMCIQSTIQKSNLCLENFIRFDLLGNETIESAERTVQKKGVLRLMKIKSVASELARQSVTIANGIGGGKQNSMTTKKAANSRFNERFSQVKQQKNEII